jgi:hypothetical protein
METTSLIDCFLNKNKKKYRFDYLKDMVMEWHESARENITKQMLYNLPFGILVYNGLYDYYGEEITSFVFWNSQREEYLDNLYKELKNNK